MANRRYELTDEQWERIKNLIPQSKMGRPPKDNHAMLWFLENSIQSFL